MRFDARAVLRRVDGADAEFAHGIERAGAQPRTHAVGQPLLFAYAPLQARIGRAAQQVIAQRQRRIVGIVVAQLQVQAGAQNRIGLVGRIQIAVDRRRVVITVGDTRERLRATPVAEQLLRQRCDFLRVEIPDDGKFAVVRPVEFVMAALQVFEANRLQALDALLQRRRVQPVLRRIGIQVAGELQAGQGVRIASLAFEAGQRRALELFEFARGKGGLAQDLRHQAHHRRQVGAQRFDRGAFAADADARLEPVELVAQLLTRVLAGAAHQHGGSQAASGAAPHLALLVAPVQGQLRHHRAAAGLFRQ